MSVQVSRGSALEYQADEQAGVAWLGWRVSGGGGGGAGGVGGSSWRIETWGLGVGK